MPVCHAFAQSVCLRYVLIATRLKHIKLYEWRGEEFLMSTHSYSFGIEVVRSYFIYTLNCSFIYMHTEKSLQCLQNLAIMQAHTYTQRLCRFPKHSCCTCGESRISGLSIVMASHCLPKELLSSSVSTTPIRVNKHSHTRMHTLYPFHYTSR